MIRIAILTIITAAVNTYSQNSTVFEATARNEINLAEYLITQKADLNITNEDGMTPLHLVRDISLANLYIKNGAEINAQNNAGSSPLHWMVSQNFIDITRLLIEYGSEINIEDYQGNTPLHLAARNTNGTIIELLIRNGAAINAVNKNGFTPILIASYYGNREISNLLTPAGVQNILQKKEEAESLIDKLENTSDSIEILISEKPDLLINTIFMDNYSKAQKMITESTNINIKDKNGNTPLHWAILKKNRFLTRQLLKKDADYKLTNNINETPIDLLIKTEDKNFRDFVQKILKDKTNFTKSIDK